MHQRQTAVRTHASTIACLYMLYIVRKGELQLYSVGQRVRYRSPAVDVRKDQLYSDSACATNRAVFAGVPLHTPLFTHDRNTQLVRNRLHTHTLVGVADARGCKTGVSVCAHWRGVARTTRPSTCRAPPTTAEESMPTNKQVRVAPPTSSDTNHEGRREASAARARNKQGGHFFALIFVVCACTSAAAATSDSDALDARMRSQTPRPLAPASVLFMPLDERFATRGLVLNLAPIAGSSFRIITPPHELLPHHKRAADPKALVEWVEARAGSAHALIASVEMLVYGGLIASRVSNDTSAEVDARIAWLSLLPSRYPAMRVLLSSVVMRIPSYNGACP